MVGSEPMHRAISITKTALLALVLFIVLSTVVGIAVDVIFARPSWGYLTSTAVLPFAIWWAIIARRPKTA